MYSKNTSHRSYINTIILIIIVVLTTGAIRAATINNINTEAVAETIKGYFDGIYAFSGGVVPFNTIDKSDFYTDSDGSQIAFSDIDIEYVKKGTQNHRSTVALKWSNQLYFLEMNDDLVCPTAQFVVRNSPIAFTIPKRIDENYFKENHLQDMGFNRFAAKEFSSLELSRFLREVDVDTNTTRLTIADSTKSDPELESKIITNIHNALGSTLQTDESDSYVNSDFHTRYQVYLVEGESQHSVDVSGLPLRYYWKIGQKKQNSFYDHGPAIIHEVEIFNFPENTTSLQYEAVLFFHNTAIFRTFNKLQPSKFKTFMSSACK